MAKVREVPSSSVYHQIFDAEVQLVRSLTKARRKASTRSRSLPRSLSCIPNQPALTAEGRVQSIDNLRNIDFSKLSENEHEAAVREVRDLPQTLVQRKTASNIVQRLNLRYSERHNEVLVQFGEDLSHISMDVEVELRQAGHSLMASLAEKEGDIEGVLAIMVREKHLENWTFQDFRVLWERVAQSWEAYRARIRETTQLFAQLEEMRAMRLVNQCLLANRWALARLTLQLLEGAVCGEARNHGCWQDHLTTWRDAHLWTALTSCRVYITAQPKQLLFENSELESMISQLNFLVEHRVKLVRDLMKMNPPEFSIALVSSWHSSIEEVNAVIDNLHTSLVSKMRVNCDELNFRCQEEMKRHQESLQALGVCDETKAQEIFVREFSPLAQAKQISAEQAVESTKCWLQAAENRAVEYVKYLRKIADGAAALWQVLLNNAAFCEEKLQESWHVCQKSHESLQQKKEAIFQTLLKRLRQESSEKALNVALQKVCSLLSDTKAAHEAFHRKQEAILPLAAKERIDHCKALCKYFGLKVKSQQELNSGQENPEEMEQQDSFTTSIKNTFYFPPNEGRALRKRLAETLCSGFLDAPSPSSIFPTKVLPAACVCLPYLDNAGIPEGIIITTECGFCQAFCEAVDVYCKNAEDEMCMLIEKHLQELRAEVSLQIQVNESRKAQIESETYNVRLGELVEHRRRLHLHCTTVQNGMVQLRTGHHALINEYDVHAEDLQKLLASFEAPLVEVCQMERFSKVIASLHADLDKHRESVRSIMPRFLQQRDSTMAQMMESNKRFIGSLRLFSNGENFSQEEVESSQKRLDKLEHKMVMDATSLVAKMSSTEAKWLERVTEQASKFEQRFKNHAVGVCFVECIQRQLRSTWIRVKAEVLKSETQSRDLASALEAFKQKFHVFLDPDTGSQEVVSDSLWLCLQDILKKAQIRAQYLDCFQTNHKVSATLDMDPHSTQPLHVSLHGAQPLTRHSTEHHSSTENYADPDVPLDQNILGKSRDIFDAGKVGEQTSGEVAVHSGQHMCIVNQWSSNCTIGKYLLYSHVFFQ
uniref:DUF4455 domain-containing protein n=1 Tax=Eptatretus burgeri TaxID=7764 RepID=A0A8C4Q219_EPTBU